MKAYLKSYCDVFFQKYFYYSIITSVLKGLKLHLLMPCAGFIFLLKEKKISHIFMPLLAMIAYGFLLAIFYVDLSSALRLLQFLGIILFFSYFLNKSIDWVKIITTICFFSCLVFLYDYFYLGSTYIQKPILGLQIMRYKGLIREYNFSAALYLSLLVISFHLKKKVIPLIFLFLIVMTGSRSALLSVALFSIFWIIHKYNKKVSTFVIILLCFYPIIFGVFDSLNNKLLMKYNRISSQRIVLQKATLELSKKNPLGVGYFRGRDALSAYYKKQVSKQQLAREPHNIFFQILFEFGVIGYLIFIYFIISLLKYQRHSELILPVIINFCFLNALHEVSFYLPLIYVLNLHSKNTKPERYI